MSGIVSPYFRLQRSAVSNPRSGNDLGEGETNKAKPDWPA